jgi:hypothetical protein
MLRTAVDANITVLPVMIISMETSPLILILPITTITLTPPLLIAHPLSTFTPQEAIMIMIMSNVLIEIHYDLRLGLDVLENLGHEAERGRVGLVELEEVRVRVTRTRRPESVLISPAVALVVMIIVIGNVVDDLGVVRLLFEALVVGVTELEDGCPGRPAG